MDNYPRLRITCWMISSFSGKNFGPTLPLYGSLGGGKGGGGVNSGGSSSSFESSLHDSFKGKHKFEYLQLVTPCEVHRFRTESTREKEDSPAETNPPWCTGHLQWQRGRRSEADPLSVSSPFDSVASPAALHGSALRTGLYGGTSTCNRKDIQPVTARSQSPPESVW